MRVLASVQRAAARPIAGTVSGEITGAISSCFERQTQLDCYYW
jgi:hypothetical protein